MVSFFAVKLEDGEVLTHLPFQGFSCPMLTLQCTNPSCKRVLSNVILNAVAHKRNAEQLRCTLQGSLGSWINKKWSQVMCRRCIMRLPDSDQWKMWYINEVMKHRLQPERVPFTRAICGDWQGLQSHDMEIIVVACIEDLPPGSAFHRPVIASLNPMAPESFGIATESYGDEELCLVDTSLNGLLRAVTQSSVSAISPTAGNMNITNADDLPWQVEMGLEAARYERMLQTQQQQLQLQFRRVEEQTRLRWLGTFPRNHGNPALQPPPPREPSPPPPMEPPPSE